MLSRQVLGFLALVFVAAVAAAAEPTETPAAKDAPLVGDAARKALIHLMRENRQKYGDDAAIMQGLLMMHAVQTEAVLATESMIRGFEESAGRRFVAFHVGSGVVFNDKTTDKNGRLKRIWEGILERTFQRYETFTVPADGILVEIQYSHRPYADVSQLYSTIDDEGTKEQVKFYLLSADLKEFLEHRVSAPELLGRSRVLLDEQPVVLDLGVKTPTAAAAK